jgi:hypothetical protein
MASLAWQALCAALTSVWALALATLAARGPELKGQEGALGEDVSVIVPMRDEARHIDAAIASALSQGGGPREVIVVDDGSTDDSLPRARAWETRDPRVKVLEAGPLPEGWAGKAWACHVGARAAKGRWLLFMDADSRLGPGALRAAVGYVLSRKLDALSLRPGLRVKGLLAGCVYCVLGFLIRALYPPRLINRPGSKRGLFYGGFILIRADRYWAMGGHEAVRYELVEDYALGRLCKQAGLRTELLRAPSLVISEAEPSARDVYEMVRRITSAPLDGRRVLALAFAAILLALAWLPWPCLIVGLAQGLGMSAALPLLLLFANLYPELREMRLSPLCLLTVPLGAGLIAAAALSVAFSYQRGAIRWRGREYRPKGHKAT